MAKATIKYRRLQTEDLVKALRIEDIAPAEGVVGAWTIHLSNRRILIVADDWYANNAPHVGGFIIFNLDESEHTFKCEHSRFVSGAEFKNLYIRHKEAVQPAAKEKPNFKKLSVPPSADSAYEAAITKERNRVLKLVRAWDNDNGTKYPEELSVFLDKIKNGQM